MIAANEAIADFQLVKFKVENVNIKTFDFKTAGSANIEIQIGYDLEKGEDEAHWFGKINFLTKLHAKDNDDDVFDIELKSSGAFSSEKHSIDQEKFQTLLEINGLTILVQMVRSYVLAATCQWGIGEPVTLPLINIHELIAKKKEQVGDKADS